MKRFINSNDDIVTEALDGFLGSAGGSPIARLDGYPDIKVIVRSDWDKSRVAIVSGGGSGHEPAHAGFVGEGMLTAAVCGDIFASPSVDAVLAAILSVTGEAGCLLIVKNYTGDRLNFGLAAEKAKTLGYNVKMVIVADDIAIPDALQPRGVAGTLFVHKIVGFLASQGGALRTVAETADDLVRRIYSIGLSLDTCTVPGNAKEAYLKPELVELGLGIHGEPGASKIAFASAKQLMAVACRKIEDVIGDTDNRFALILNNLGSVPPIEMQILANAFFATPLADKVELVIGPAHLMTSLDMYGFSISLLRLKEGDSRALQADTAVMHWPRAREGHEVTVVDSPQIGSGSKFEVSEDAVVRQTIMAVCETLIAARADLNKLDAQIGDGDTGTTFGAGAQRVMDNLDQLPLGNGADLCVALSELLSRQMGGSSGALVAIFFAATGEAYRHKPNWPSAMVHGAERMMFYGGAQPGDRTMLDALIPGLDVLAGNDSIASAATASRIGADRTAGVLQAKAGRAAYVPAENLDGVVDPGAEAIARAFEAISRLA